jgi:hypothetical protein
MQNNQINIAIKSAISDIVADFQKYSDRFWNERDIHWSLFYYLKQELALNEAYPTELIRAEFPTLKVFPGERPARGHYDLVIINAESCNKPEVQNMKAQASWDDYLSLIELEVAIEIKLWLNRLQPEAMKERVDWDIQKLTDEAKNVKNTYFLNFVQLDFQREHNKTYYQQLRDYLARQKKPGLNISCVPSDPSIQRRVNENWL